MKKLIISGLLVVGAWKLFSGGAVSLGPGVKVESAPTQVNITGEESFSYEGYTITPLASFDIKAKVLSRKDYSFGREAELSPIDLALGWGAMSDESVLEHIEISQSGRWYHWRVQEFPIPRREIETNSANMHLIPADDVIERSIKRVKEGEIIELKGKLVKVEASDGWHWISSLTREDTGAHACEVIWVDSFYVLNL